MATSNSRSAEPTPVTLHLRTSASDTESHTLEDAEENPLMGLDSSHLIKPISPTPVDSIGIPSTHPMIEPLKAPNINNNIHTHMHSNAGHHWSGKQLMEHIECIVTNYVTHHNHMSHSGHDRVLPTQAIKSTLRKLRSQLAVSDSDIFPMRMITNTSSSYDESPVALKNLRSRGESIVPMLRTGSHDDDEMIKIDEQNTNNENNNNQQPLKWCTHSLRAEWTEFLPSSALLHHPSYSIAVDKYWGILRGSVRQDWNTIETDDDEERNWQELKPHWFELFFDLMFVAAIVHISTEVADAYQDAQYIFISTVFPQFGLLILCWLEQVLYHSRFRMTQSGDGLLRFLYMSLVLMMGLSIGNWENEISQNLFLISYMFTKIIMCIMFIKSSLILRARAHSIYMIVENAVSIVSIIAIAIYTMNVEGNIYDEWPWFWCVVYSVLFVYSWSHMVVFIYFKWIRDRGVNIPINVPHMNERMGALVLIILGETIISIMVQHVESTRQGILTAYGVTMSLFIIVYSIGKLYFESQPSEHEIHHHKKSHAMSRSLWRARIYKWFHIVLFFGLLGLGLGSKITVHELPHYDIEHNIHIFVLGISCCIICCAINIIRLTHPFDYSEEHPYLVCAVWCARIACILVMAATVLFASHILHHAVIAAVYIVCFAIQIIIDFEARKRLIITKTVDKDKSLFYYKSATNNIISEDCVEMTVTNELSFIGAF